MNKRETATVLAALRHWQAFILEHPEGDQGLIDEIATDGGTIEPLPPDEIDALCNLLNDGRMECRFRATREPTPIQQAAANQLDRMLDIAAQNEIDDDMKLDIIDLYDALVLDGYDMKVDTKLIGELRDDLEAISELKF